MPQSILNILRRNVRAIEDYERLRESEQERLLEPLQSRMRDFWSRMHPDELIAVPPVVRPAEIYNVLTPAEHQEILQAYDTVQAELRDFDRLQKPSVEPFDTPAKILKWFEENEWLWNGGFAGLAGVNRQGEREQLTSEKARVAYREIRERALAFIILDPALAFRFSATVDPLLGLQDIRAWATRLQSELSAPVDERAQTPNGHRTDTSLDGHFSPRELAARYSVDAEDTRKALDRWRRKHSGSDGYTENPDRRQNEPKFLYSPRAVEHVMDELVSRAARRQSRRTNPSSQRPAR